MTIELSDEKLKSDNGMMKRLLAHFIAKEGGEVKIPMRSIHSVSDAESVEVSTDFMNRVVRLRCGHRIPVNPEPEHQEFLMAADLLEERGMDRAAKALRGCLQLIALRKRAWLDSLTSTVQADRLRHTDAVDAMSFASLYLQQPARVTCGHRWEFNESESSRKCLICGDVQVSTPLARNQPCGGVCAVNEHNRRCRLCGWSVRDAEIWRNEQERRFIQVTK